MKFQRVGFKPVLRASLAAVLLISMMLSTAMPAGAVSSPVSNVINQTGTTGNAPAFAGTNDSDKLLQFTSAGHVLGFSEDGVMIASGDHMLKTEFIGSRAVAPQADAAVAEENSAAIASPLSRVTYHNVWDDVTVVYEATPGAIVESTYYINATEKGVPVERIRLGYNRLLSIDDKGNLVIAYESGTMLESAPAAWQEIDGKRAPVGASFVLYGEREAGFTLGDYAPGIPVVIDPALAWNTFLGGSDDDFGRAIAVDGSGNVYVAGYSNATWGAPVREYEGGITDVFAARLDKNGTLIWNTFLGSSGPDYSDAIAVGGSGNVYVAGTSDATWGAPVRDYTGGGDAFVARLNSTTGVLTWNTFLGGDGTDSGKAIAVDGSGNVYVAGNSQYSSWGDPVRAFSGDMDAFVAKLNSTTGVLTWHTFLGGSGEDQGNAIAVGGSGNVYVAGTSDATWGAPVRDYTVAGVWDAFAVGLDSSGVLTWNTFLGGSYDDYGTGIAVDGSGNVYVAGFGGYTWQGATTPVRAFSGGRDAFVARLNSATGVLTWNTFLGGSDDDYGTGIAVDSSGNIYVAGYSDNTWGYPLWAHTPDLDVFDASVVRLNSSTGSLIWNTFLGGSGDDYGQAIAVDGSGNAYVAGDSNATWGSPRRAYYGSGQDAFAAKIASSMTPVSGNWNGTGGTEIGAYYNGTWYLDYNGNGAWNGAVTDRQYSFGSASMTPVTGDWNNDGKTEIGAYYNGTWYLDYNGNGAWNGAVTDRQYSFGSAAMTPVTGNWNGTGGTEIGAYHNGTWYLDYNGNGAWNGAVTDRQYSFGSASMKPVSGNWNGAGGTEIGAYYNGTWYLDYNGNGAWNGSLTDRQYSFGSAAMTPVSGNWNGIGGTEIGAYLNGTWYLDYNGNGAWNGAVTDRQYSFGN